MELTIDLCVAQARSHLADSELVVDATAALPTNTAAARRPQHRPGKSTMCFTCGELGHVRSSCLQGQARRRKPVTCFDCGQQGHIKWDCRVKKPEKIAALSDPLSACLVSVMPDQPVKLPRIAVGCHSSPGEGEWRQVCRCRGHLFYPLSHLCCACESVGRVGPYDTDHPAAHSCRREALAIAWCC